MVVQEKSLPNTYFLREVNLYDAGTYRVAIWTDFGSDLKEFNLSVYPADDPFCKGVCSSHNIRAGRSFTSLGAPPDLT